MTGCVCGVHGISEKGIHVLIGYPKVIVDPEIDER
jgi:hypothetical protein